METMYHRICYISRSMNLENVWHPMFIRVAGALQSEMINQLYYDLEGLKGEE